MFWDIMIIEKLKCTTSRYWEVDTALYLLNPPADFNRHLDFAENGDDLTYEYVKTIIIADHLDNTPVSRLQQ